MVIGKIKLGIIIFFFIFIFVISGVSALVLNVSSPQEIVYNKKKVEFKIETDELAKKIEYINLDDVNARLKTLCIDCLQFGVDRERKLTMVEGKNRVTIRAVDKFGNLSEINITLIVESFAPVIFKTQPRENAVVNGSEFFIQYKEDNLVNITLFYGTEENKKTLTLSNCESGKNKKCFFPLDLSEFEGKAIRFNYLITDLISSKKTQETRVKVDTISPVLTINNPEENKNYGRTVPINITSSEKVKIEYKDKSDSKPAWRSLCSNCDEFGFSEKKIKTLSKGFHQFLIRAVDKAGNSDLKAVNFNVD